MRVLMEKTLALIKPDAVKAGRVRDIYRWIEDDSFSILRRKELQLSKQTAEDFYHEHRSNSYFTKLITFMTSGPIVAMILSRQDAIRRWRELMGPTNSVLAREQAPRSIRAICGTDGTYNAVHGSDSCQSAQREIRFFFPETDSDIPSSGDADVGSDIQHASENVERKLNMVLLEGLTVLAKKKPTGNKHDAVRYLGEWLIANNPNKPKNDLWPAGIEGEHNDGLVQAIETDNALNVYSEIRSAQSTKASVGMGMLSKEETAISEQEAYRGYQTRRRTAMQ